MKKNLKGFLAILLIAAAALVIYGRNHRSISFNGVPNYDLLVRDVAKGDETIEIIPMEVMPEGEYYYGVAYKGGILKLWAKGYMIESPSREERWGVTCKPRDFYEQEQGVVPNGELWGIPVRFSGSDQVQENGYWAKSITFELKDHVYALYCQSFTGNVIHDADAILYRMAAGIIPGAPESERYGLTGTTWQGPTRASLLGVGVEEPTTLEGTVTITFHPEERCTIATDFGPDMAPTSGEGTYSIKGDQLTLLDETFTFTLDGDTLTLSGRAELVLTRVG